MEILTENTQAASFNGASLDVKIRILKQMAKALEDEADGLFRRAAIFDEEEFSINREIQQHQNEIKRLQLKLQTMRVERERVVGKIREIQQEVAAMRDEIYNNEEEVALANISGSGPLDLDLLDPAWGQDQQPQFHEGQPPAPIFFHRLTLP